MYMYILICIMFMTTTLVYRESRHLGSSDREERFPPLALLI